MRIFVLSAGRTASTTFARACEVIDGMTASHESLSGLRLADLRYPDNHIEIDNRLSWLLGSIEKKYREQDVGFVWLKRDHELVAKSYSQRWFNPISIVRAYARGVLRDPRPIPKIERLDFCKSYVEVVDANIESFLKGRNNYVVISIDNLSDGFDVFLDKFGFSCDREKAKQALSTVTNKNQHWWGKISVAGLVRRFKRLIKKIPECVMSA